MKLSTLLIIIILITLWFSLSLFSREVEKPMKLNLSADGIKILEIDCGAGYLKVKGIDGLKQIEVDTTLVVKGIDDDELEEFKKEHVELSLEKRGEKACLTSEIDSGFSISSLFKHKEAHINLEVRVPKNLELDVDDGSGFVEIYDVNGDVELEDGSGSIIMENLQGKVSIDDGSGSIVLDNIGGDLEIEDGSGEIKITKVAGDVDIDDDSGEIDISDIRGSVVVDDGSGGIIIERVEKDVTITNAGSGSVDIREVKGKVRK